MSVNIEYLPDEILVRILSFLPQEEFISLSTVNQRFNNLTCDGLLIRDLDLRKSYQYNNEDFKKFFLQRTRCFNIKHINMNHVYWSKLPNLIVKLKNLESLHILGTSLTFMQLKWILNSCPKLCHLSISWPDDMQTVNKKQWRGGLDEVSTNLPNLASLQVLIHKDPKPLLCLLVHCNNLRKLVITNHHAKGFFNTPSIPSDSGINLNFPHLEELIVDHADGAYPDYLNTHIVQIILDGVKHAGQWSTFWMNTQHELHTNEFHRPNGEGLSKCRQLFLVLTPYIINKLQKLQTFHNLQTLLIKGMSPRNENLTSFIKMCPALKNLHVLFGLNVSLDLKKVSEMLPSLERLSICCQPNQGPTKILNAIANLRHLTHLTVPVCALMEKQECTDKTTSAYSLGFKKARVGISLLDRVNMAAFNQVFLNCPNIRILEIGYNRGPSCHPGQVLWECLVNTNKLKKLTHLTLDGIPIINGAFFLEICKNCTKLEFIRIRNLGASGKCCYDRHLIEALPYCKNLKHLRIEQNYLAPATGILSSLKKCPNLLRLFIHSERDSQNLDVNGLSELIEFHSSLVFVFVVGGGTSKEKCTKITRKFKHWSRPALIVRVRSILWDVFDDKNVDNRTIPACHYNEIITFRSWAHDSYKFL